MGNGLRAAAVGGRVRPRPAPTAGQSRGLGGKTIGDTAQPRAAHAAHSGSASHRLARVRPPGRVTRAAGPRPPARRAMLAGAGAHWHRTRYPQVRALWRAGCLRPLARLSLLAAAHRAPPPGRLLRPRIWRQHFPRQRAREGARARWRLTGGGNEAQGHGGEEECAGRHHVSCSSVPRGSSGRCFSCPAE